MLIKSRMGRILREPKVSTLGNGLAAFSFAKGGLYKMNGENEIYPLAK